MTCKDCLCKDVCFYIRNAEDVIAEINPLACPHFKPKSRFVELPCEDGQTVYFIDVCRTAEDFGKSFVNFGVVTKVSCDNKFVVVKGGSILGWGCVFLSREEAEKALKEREDR